MTTPIETPSLRNAKTISTLTLRLQGIDQVEYGPHLVVNLPASMEASAVARLLTRAQLCRWNISLRTTEIAERLASELVTDAIRHGVAPVTLHLAHNEDSLTVTVHNASRELAPHTQKSWATQERDLRLVEILADSFAISCSQFGTFAVAILHQHS
jgi:hypothetical protein